MMRLLSEILRFFPWVFGVIFRNKARREKARADDLQGQLNRKKAEDEISSDNPADVARKLHKWDQ